MIKLGTLYWEMAVDSQKLNDGLNSSEKQVQTFASRAEVGLNKAAVAFAALGVAAAAVAIKAGRAMFDFTKDAVALASAAEEAGSKFNVVFGSGARQAEADLAALANTVQRSKYELKEMAASVQDVFVPMGFARDEAQKLSMSLTELAIDVGSFNNVADGEAMAAFQSALVGNHEAVRRFGIVISEATLKQELMNMGIEGGVQKATELEKVQARLNLLFRMTSDAQGDAARTADSWANTMRGLESAIRDVQTDIGDELLPVLTPMLNDFTEFAREVGPEVARQAGMIAEAFVAMAQVMERVDLSGVTAQFEALEDAVNVDFWSEVFGFIGKQIALTVTNFQQLGAEIERLVAEVQLLGDFLSRDISWSEYQASMIALRTEYQEVQAAFTATYDEINGKDWGQVVEAQAEINRLNAEATDWWQRHGTAAAEAATEIVETVAPAMQSMADVWGSVWEQIQGISATGAENTRYQVLSAFGDLAQDYASHAEAIVQIEQERDQYLLFLEATYQQQADALRAAGRTADLAQLTAAHQAKYNSALGFYNGRIKLEQVGQQTIYNTAREYYVLTLRTLITQLQAQVRTVVASMRAMVQATVPGYMAMAAAAMAFNRAKAGAQAIGELTSAISEVQQAMAGIEAAGVAAADQAGAAFAAWEASVGDLGTGIDEVDGALGNLTRPSGSGSNIRPIITDPLNDAAKTAAALASMVEKAIEAFDKLAEFGAPAAGWQEALAALLEAITQMVIDWGDAVDDLNRRGLIEKAGELQTAAKMLVDIAKAFDAAMKTINGLDMPYLQSGVTEAVAEQMVALVGVFDDAATAIEEDLPESRLDMLATTAERIVKVLAPWKAAADAVKAVASVEGIDIRDGAQRLASTTKGLVEWVDWLIDNLPDGSLSAVAAKAEKIVKALSPWKAAADAVKAIAGAAGIRIEDASQQLIWMAEGLVRWMNWLSSYLPTGMIDEVAAKAEKIVKALSPWKAAADAVKAIAGAAGIRIEDASRQLIWMAEGLVRWMNWLSSYLPTGMLDTVAETGEKIVKALAPWKAVADAVNAIASAAGIRIEDASQQLIWMAEGLVRWMDWLIDYLPWGMLEEVAAKADMVVKAVSPWKAVADAVNAIASAAGVRIENAARMLIFMTYDLVKWMDWLIDYLPWGMLEEVAAKADMVVRAVSPWRAVADAVKSVADVAGVRIENAARMLIFMTYDLVKWMDWLIDYLPWGMLEEVAAKADMVVKAVSPWRAIMDAVAALGTRISAADIPGKAKILAEASAALILALDAIVARVGRETLDRAALIAKKLVDVLEPWERAIILADEMRAWKLMPDLEDKFARFARQWVTIIENLAKALDELETDGLEKVEIFSTTLESLVTGLAEALELALAAPANWTINTGAWNAFEDWVKGVFLDFYAWVNSWGDDDKIVPLFDDGGLDLVGKMASALSALMSGLKTALDLALSMPDTWDLDQGVWDSFVAWVKAVFLDFYQWIQNDLARIPPWEPGASPGDPSTGIGLVQSFGNALSALMEGLQAALGLALAMPNRWSVDPGVWDSFVAWVKAVFLDFYQWIQNDLAKIPPWEPGAKPGDPSTGIGLVQSFGNALQALMEGLRAALDLALAMPDTWDLDQGVWDSFVAWVKAVFLDFYQWIQNDLAKIPPWEPGMEPGDPSTGIGLVQSFGEALSALMGGLKSALDVALAMPDTWDLDQGVWDSFVAWVKGVFMEFYVWVNRDLAGALPVEPGMEPTDPATAMGLVATFGQALTALMDGLASALQFALSFPRFANWPTGEVWDNFKRWVMQVFQEFQEWIEETFHPEDPDQFAPVASFGTAMQALFDGLLSALDLFRGIVGWVGGGSVFQDRLTFFLQEVKARFLEISAFVEEELDPVVTAATGDFGDALGRLVGGLKSALDFFVQLADTNPATYTASHEFKVRVQTLIRSIHEVLLAFQEYIENEEINLWIPTADYLFDAFDRMVGVLRDALSLFVDLEASNLPTPNELQEFIDLVIQLFEDLAGAIIGAGIGVQEGARSVETGISNAIVTMRNWVPEFQTLGITYANSIARGMRDNIGVVINAAAALGAAAESGTANALQIASPSRVAERLAGFFVQGFVGTLDAGRSDVDTAMRGLMGPQLALASGGLQIDSNKHIVVEFIGHAAGGVPLSVNQFDMLKRELIWELQRGA